MRIALLTDGIHPFVIGGMQKHSWYLARYLARAGVEVDLYHCVPFGEELPEQLEGFSEQELEKVHVQVFHFPPPGKLPGHYIRNSKKYSKTLFEAFQKRPEVDLVYAQGFTGWYMMEQKAAGQQLPPIGVNFHGLNMFQEGKADLRGKLENKLFKKPVQQNLELADCIFSLGGKLSDIQRNLVSHPDKVVDLPNGVEASWLVDKITTSQERCNFLFVGRFDKVKGLEVIYDAIESGEELDADFNFVGPIPKEHQLYDGRCKYFGVIKEQEQMKQLYSDADVLLLASWSEGMPTVILEAMACGTMIISTDVGAVRELVDGTHGWLFEPGDTGALTAHMHEAANQSAERQNEMKNEGVRKVREQFTWEAVSQRTIEVFKKMINEI